MLITGKNYSGKRALSVSSAGPPPTTYLVPGISKREKRLEILLHRDASRIQQNRSRRIQHIARMRTNTDTSTPRVHKAMLPKPRASS